MFDRSMLRLRLKLLLIPHEYLMKQNMVILIKIDFNFLGIWGIYILELNLKGMSECQS